MRNTSLITGITGQDGAYLAKLLLDKGYRVVGCYRRTSNPNFQRLSLLGIMDRVELVPMDLTDQGGIMRILREVKPDEIYNLAAQSFVGISFDQPITTAQINGIGVANLLEAVRAVGQGIRFYQASTSEMFGKVQAVPQNEATAFYPRSPYAAAKLYAHWMTVIYRESYDMYACCGILFNHESPLRGLEFVTRKITSTVAAIKSGREQQLKLGNLDAMRDWGYAPEYVEAMWLMLQQEHPKDFVISTGETHSVREFAEEAFACAGLSWHDHVVVDPAFLRPAEVDLLVGDSAKAKAHLGWKPRVTFKDLVRLMVEADLALIG
ncbi:MAG: GDP-mannose 4,6-dehydratase [Peptococcaceae bacterium]|jgi:GDPmannose 4,6-dehydratase|nr:GDP-mannose 4,6-dehydratase [Peptococcaceae bacterium]